MINKALEGEEVVITRNGEDTVKLVPATNGAKQKSWIGSLEGQIVIHDNFDAPLDDDETVKYLTGELDTPLPE
jgi:antitoxin (DNA-binding transcriptional repressor) of toxin-antitoxin stability system